MEIEEWRKYEREKEEERSDAYWRRLKSDVDAWDGVEYVVGGIVILTVGIPLVMWLVYQFL